MSSIVAPVYKSIIRATSDMIDDMNATGRFPILSYHSWEERADEEDLPKNTLIGVDGFSFQENEGRWLIAFAMGVSSYKDANLMNEIEIIDAIQTYFGEKHKVKLLNMDDGSEFSELVVTDFSILPMGQSELRNYRTIGIELKRTENFKT